MIELDEIVKEFLVESYENLDRLDRDLVALEKDPGNRDTLSSVFRTIHTIKGTCGFFGFGKLEAVAHVGENLLSRLRDGELVLNPPIASALLALVDAVREMLACIETTGQDGNQDYPGLIATLSRLQMGEPVAAAPAPSEALPPPPSPALPPPQTEDLESKARASQLARQSAELQVTAPASEIVSESADLTVQAHPSQVARPSAKLEVKARASQLRRKERGKSFSRPPSRDNAGKQRAGAGEPGGTVSDGSIRVDVGLLDKLMNLVGELVLARNQILQFTASQPDPALLGATQRLNLITSELQEGFMKTRMQPIGNVWSKFPRVVRDLAMTCGKEVRLEMLGKETELDKTIIEAIKDPLTHLVRNTVDHGIEPPAERLARGKPAEGCLSLRAFHEGGQVNIEISDDGGGIHLDKVKERALERGLLTREQATRLSDRELAQLIFAPGFSTADKVTNVSGRGVGMDVVKTNIEKIGGTVDLHTCSGKGTTVKIKIPLTLAIIPALIVSSEGDRYAIPQVSLLELVRLEGEAAQTEIEQIHGAPVYRLRGKLLPIVDLRREFGDASEWSVNAADAVNIVVLRADECQFGLVVDSINDTEEIVVKPLGSLLKHNTLFAGATIMGDGRVALILDILGIAQRAGVVGEVRERTPAETVVALPTDQPECQTLLLLERGGNQRLAVPLALVARLEEIPAADVEFAAGREVVQYRDEIMPLLRLSSLLGDVVGGEDRSILQVVVYVAHGQSVGVVVEHIVDIVEAVVALKTAGRGRGMLGSAVIQERVTDLLDLAGLVEDALPEYCGQLVEV